MTEQTKRVYLYSGNNAEVAWDERLCIHVGECGRAKNDLFIGGREPWCQPDLVVIDEVLDVIARCPSGALSARRKDGGANEAADPENVVVVSNNGPLYVRGELVIEGAPQDMPGVRFRAALCRCGRSENKPFCDNTHEAVAFHDRGAIGEAGGEAERGGALRIEPTKDGPLRLSGNFTMIAASGRTALHAKKASLCRCGQSSNKPFCDGSHKAAGFRG